MINLEPPLNKKPPAVAAAPRSVPAGAKRPESLSKAPCLPPFAAVDAELILPEIAPVTAPAPMSNNPVAVSIADVSVNTSAWSYLYRRRVEAHQAF